MKLRCYYAHPITDYGSEIEKYDLLTLQLLGFEVLNPNNPVYDAAYKIHGIGFFTGLVAGCDVLAYRAFNDGSIPAGVYVEVNAAYNLNLPVIELPNMLHRKVLTVEETRAKLKELGRA